MASSQTRDMTSSNTRDIFTNQPIHCYSYVVRLSLTRASLGPQCVCDITHTLTHAQTHTHTQTQAQTQSCAHPHTHAHTPKKHTNTDTHTQTHTSVSGVKVKRRRTRGRGNPRTILSGSVDECKTLVPFLYHDNSVPAGALDPRSLSLIRSELLPPAL